MKGLVLLLLTVLSSVHCLSMEIALFNQPNKEHGITKFDVDDRTTLGDPCGGKAACPASQGTLCAGESFVYGPRGADCPCVVTQGYSATCPQPTACGDQSVTRCTRANGSALTMICPGLQGPQCSPAPNNLCDGSPCNGTCQCNRDYEGDTVCVCVPDCKNGGNFQVNCE